MNAPSFRKIFDEMTLLYLNAGGWGYTLEKHDILWAILSETGIEYKKYVFIPVCLSCHK